MNTLQIKDVNNRAVELSFSKLTQICGCDTYSKNYVMRYIANYFSRKRYSDDEMEAYLGKEPKILINGEVVSRGRYECTHITSIECIEDELMFLKDTTLYKYILSSFQSVDISENINRIDDAVLQIANNFETALDPSLFGNIEVRPTIIDQDMILKRFIDARVTSNGLYLNYATGLEKLSLYFKLQEELSKIKSDRKLILISNIEKIIRKDEIEKFNELVQVLLKSDVHFIIESNTTGYILGDAHDIESVNILGDINITLPDIHTLTDSINRNYPTDKTFCEQKIYEIFKRVANNLFDNRYVYSHTEDDVIIKILNSFYNIECACHDYISLAEKNFLF